MRSLNLLSFLIISLLLISCRNTENKKDSNNYEIVFVKGEKSGIYDEVCNVLIKQPNGQTQVLERFACDASMQGTDTLLYKDITKTKDFSYIDSLKIPVGYGTVLKQCAAIQNYTQITNPASEDITFFRYILFKRDNTISLVKELWEDNSFTKKCMESSKEIYSVNLLENGKNLNKNIAESTNDKVPENSTFQNQPLKAGERIVVIKWEMQNTVEIRPHDGGHYCSNVNVVPTGKKWVLLYNIERIKFSNGSEMMECPMISIDGQIEDNILYGKDYENTNLDKMRDKALRFYSGSKIMGIDNDAENSRRGRGTVSESGELCFLEINS